MRADEVQDSNSRRPQQQVDAYASKGIGPHDSSGDPKQGRIGPLAHKGAIGRHHGGPGGPPNWSRNPGRSRKLFSGRVWGEMALPKGLLGTIQSNPLAQIPLKPHGEPLSPQNHVFRAPFFGPKRSPGQPGSKFGIWGPQHDPWGRKYPQRVFLAGFGGKWACPKAS